MRLFLAAAAIVPLVSTPAAAESWYHVGGNENAQTYVDLDGVRAVGNKTVATIRTVYAKPLCDEDDGGGEQVCNVWSGGIRSEYDCAGNSFRTLEYTYFDVDGGLIGTEASLTINQQRVPGKNTINEAAMGFICFRNGGEFVSDLYADAQYQFDSY